MNIGVGNDASYDVNLGNHGAFDRANNHGSNDIGVVNSTAAISALSTAAATTS
jgi:hypothetical protein